MQLMTLNCRPENVKARNDKGSEERQGEESDGRALASEDYIEYHA